jgi:hypothetical protein
MKTSLYVLTLFLVGFTQPVDILTRISSEDFSSTAAKYPEKKEGFVSLAEKIEETDNKLLTIVRLKERTVILVR